MCESERMKRAHGPSSPPDGHADAADAADAAVDDTAPSPTAHALADLPRLLASGALGREFDVCFLPSRPLHPLL